ncbi:MAG: hypothetical protein A2Y10_06760 [Planctomycetes bacterium GWF2_41_51]|nr:MAG: hypothetical protein A2Y10_06760 [Planctomycetes bacterium GWF2_41_51]HBG27827.1 hypothetical protein [Phycisphaerales bacterium]
MKKSLSIILIFCLISFITVNGCRKSTPVSDSDSNAAQTIQQTESNISKSLQDIVDRSTSWAPILQNFYGKEVPDFQVTDINGKTHKLSEYRGKNVMVVMWATWCQPCMQEVPHLNAIREIMAEDKLAMLAISNENIELVKKTAQSKNMKYNVIATQETLPPPFSNVRGIPTTFFIRPDGTLKLVTEGAAYLGEMKAIILAE